MARRLPSLNALKAFEAAARNESFTDGAAELFVTHAAVMWNVYPMLREAKTKWSASNVARSISRLAPI